MTIHYYNASLVGPSKEEFHATVFWDKTKPSLMTVHLSPKEGPHQYGYPVWTSEAPHRKSNLAALVARLRKKSVSMELRFVAEAETQYASGLREGDEN